MAWKSCVAAILIAVGSVAGANAHEPAAESTEGPELSRRGSWAIGTSYQDVTLPNRVRLSAQGPVDAQRTVGVRFWYPADAAGTIGATYRHDLKMADGSAHGVVEHGIASDDARPAHGKFPLVIMSHGFGGWAEQMSRLGEHLASRGYVVASIDHRDGEVNSIPTFQISFGNVLVDRSLDQKQLLSKLADRRFVKATPALNAADMGSIALVGYSMGGYGALATAGGDYDAKSPVYAALPPASRDMATAPNSDVKIKSLILFAPWGGQPSSRVWNDAGLAKMTKPTLIIAGDQDDVVNFKGGVRWLFDGLKNADRHLLAYREARHNVVGNPVDAAQAPSAEIIGFTREPVWRQERLNQINQHFVTAFLDATIKGDASRKAYLDVPTPLASDGEWPTNFGEIDSGKLAGDGQPKHWRGFQRRWAVGIELHHKTNGQ